MRRFALRWVEEALRERGRARRDPDDPLDVLLLDPFAGADYDAGRERVPLGVEAGARMARHPRPAGGAQLRLLDADPVKVEWLRGAAGALPHPTPDAPLPLLAVEEGGPGDLPPIDPATTALMVLDPPSAGALPLDRVAGWLGEGKTELLLRLPTADLHRLSRYRGFRIADLPPHGRRLVEGISAWLGDPRGEWVLEWGRLATDPEPVAVAAVVSLYLDRLGAHGVDVHRVEVPREAGPETLLLVTRRGAAPLLLNRAVHDLREEGLLARPDETGEWVRYEPVEEISLFPMGAAASTPHGCRRVLDLPRLAHALAERFAGRTLSLDELSRAAASGGIFAEELRHALVELRREGRALFRSLGAPDAAVAFPRGRRAAVPRAARRSRRSEQAALPLGGE